MHLVDLYHVSLEGARLAFPTDVPHIQLLSDEMHRMRLQEHTVQSVPIDEIVFPVRFPWKVLSGPLNCSRMDGFYIEICEYFDLMIQIDDDKKLF